MLTLTASLLKSPTISIAGKTPGKAAENNQSRWFFPVSGVYVHQTDTDFDKGGRFSVNKFLIQGGSTYSLAPNRNISLSIGYGFDGYDFSGNTKLLENESPWNDIQSLRFNMPLLWGIDNKWTAIAIPTLRFSAEDGAEWNEAATGGGFAGVSYRYNDRLTIGSGVGYVSQLEDSASIFPILIIRLMITDNLNLTTGSGTAATLGPGLTLNWQASRQWQFLLGGRYEKLRFRLDKNGPIPGGIGEDTSLPIIIGATFTIDHSTKINLIAGMEFDGQMRLENQDGQLVKKDRYDPSGFMGLTFQHRFY